MTKPDLGELFQGAFMPNIPAGSIISDYCTNRDNSRSLYLFLHASNVQERWNKPSDLRDSRWDTIISISVGGLITAAIIITAGATIKGLENKKCRRPFITARTNIG